MVGPQGKIGQRAWGDEGRPLWKPPVAEMHGLAVWFILILQGNEGPAKKPPKQRLKGEWVALNALAVFIAYLISSIPDLCF